MRCLLPLALSAVLLPSAAWAAKCQPAQPAAVVVEVVEAPLQTDRSLTIPALSKITRGPPLPGLSGYDHALGLTETQLQASAQGEFEGEIRDGTVCATAVKVTVTMNWRILVRLAAEIPPGSCIEREVTRHEQRHVDLSRAFMPVARKQLADAVTKAAARGVTGASFDGARKALWARITAEINRVDGKNYAALKAKQQALDTPEEYDALPKTCGQDALQELLRR